MKKGIRRILISVAVLASLMGWNPAQANLYLPDDIVFGDVGIGTYNTFLQTPLRDSYQWSAITGKWNQPRYIPDVQAYSNPHRGVDQRTERKTLFIYPPANGWVLQKGTSTLYLELDMNRNGVQDDGVIFGYQHLSSVLVEREGQSVTRT